MTPIRITTDRIAPIPGLTHKTPNKPPYCALCATFLHDWPLIKSDLCGKCEDKERKAA